MSGTMVEAAPRRRRTGARAALVDASGAGLLEQGLVVVTLLAYARSTVLFAREQVLGDSVGPLVGYWSDDAVLRTVFVALGLAVVLVGARTVDAATVRRHLPLLALLALAVASVGWSVEPSTTQLRASMFVLTTGVGWYIGSRFAPRRQIELVAVTSAVGAALSIVAAVVVPDVARTTNGEPGLWSGIYVNRNLLALALCIGLLAIAFCFASASSRGRAAWAATALVEVLLLARTASRTAVTAAVAAALLAGGVAVLRRLLGRFDDRVGLGVTLGLLGVALVALHLGWDRLVQRLGRDSTLTRRTDMWVIDRDFISRRPWRGFGFEAIWTHQPLVDEAARRFYAVPYQAHNGYYEMLLSLGRIGFVVFLAVVALTVWRCFRLAWSSTGATSLWPLTFVTFALVLNVSESLFIANEATWALFVAAGVVAARPELQTRAGRPSTAS